MYYDTVHIRLCYGMWNQWTCGSDAQYKIYLFIVNCGQTISVYMYI